MRHVALFTLLTVAGLAACNKNPLGPTQASSATPLAKSSAAAPLSSAPSATAPSATAPSAAAPSGALPTSPAAASASDASDCVQEGENTDQCGSQVEDGTPFTDAPATPETGTPETPGETPGQP